jgi:hypothetical protein
VDPLVADEPPAALHEREHRLGLAALRPSGRDDARPVVDERGRVQGEHPLGQDREIQDRDEQRDGRDPVLAHDLAARADRREVDADACAGLVPAAQEQERVVGERRLSHAEQPEGPGGGERVDEAHDDVGLAAQRGADRPELAVDGGGVGRRGVEQPHAGRAVDVVVDGVRGHGRRGLPAWDRRR